MTRYGKEMFFPELRTSSGAQLASSSMVEDGSRTGVKWPKLKAEHSSPPSVKVKSA